VPAPYRLSTIIAAASFLILASGASAQELPEDKRTLVLDLNADGKLDQATIVTSEESDALDLKIFLDAATLPAGNQRRPDYIKRDIASGVVVGFSSDENGSLSLESCFGCGAMKSFNETLTVILRDGVFLVGSYKRDWDWDTHLADGMVDTQMGGCRINFLTGEGWLRDGLEDEKPVRERFKPIALADWSDELRPAICQF
jgi:hypothetical protein